MIARSFMTKMQAMTSQSLQYSTSYIFCRKTVLPVQITHGISRSLEGGDTDWWDNSDQFENSDFLFGEGGGALGVMVKGLHIKILQSLVSYFL